MSELPLPTRAGPPAPEPQPVPEPQPLTDIHCHGAIGHAFGDSEAGSRAAAAHLRARGVESVVASLVSATDVALLAQVRTLAPLVADGTLLGIHLEGPFLAEACKGAHDPAMLRDPDPGLLEGLAQAAADLGAPGAIRQLTFAPERSGSNELVATMAALGIRPAIGHTAASAEQVRASIGLVAELTGRPALVTHLFNGMPPFHHRSGGPVAAAMSAAASGEAVVELITDGVHVAAEVVAMVFDTLGAQRIALVSDAMAATGLGDGDYALGSLRVRVHDGVARVVLADGSPGSIAGSTSSLADCVDWAISCVGIPAEEVIASATTTPMAIISRS